LLLATAQVLLSALWSGRSLLDSLLAGIALAMAILPEEIPLILTVFLALGAWRIAKQQVLTRSTSAVEALGAISVRRSAGHWHRGGATNWLLAPHDNRRRFGHGPQRRIHCAGVQCVAVDQCQPAPFACRLAHGYDAQPLVYTDDRRDDTDAHGYTGHTNAARDHETDAA
jgi:hypothetical protein